MSKETLPLAYYAFSTAMNALAELAPYGMLQVADTEEEIPEWNKSQVKHFQVSELVSTAANIGSGVRITVQGDTDWGVALVFKPKNIFSRKRHGFLIQPERDDMFSVWHGNAQPDSKLSWITAQSLDYDSATKADPALANALVSDIIKNAAEHRLAAQDTV